MVCGRRARDIADFYISDAKTAAVIDAQGRTLFELRLHEDGERFDVYAYGKNPCIAVTPYAVNHVVVTRAVDVPARE